MNSSRAIGPWVLCLFGVLVAWAIQGQSMGMSALIIILYGVFMAFTGFVTSMKHAQERRKLENDVRIRLQQEYQAALERQTHTMRKALICLSHRALAKAAGKLVAELLPKFDNEEQFDAAVQRSKRIVEEEMAEISELVGQKDGEED